MMHSESTYQTIEQSKPNETYLPFKEILNLAFQQPFKNIHDESEYLRIATRKNLLRVRAVNKRSNHRVTGKFPSKKNGLMVHWESAIELMGFRCLESHQLVKSYREQPAKIHYRLPGNKWAYHIPDVLVEFTNGNMCFIEFKDDRDIYDQDLLSRTNFLAMYLPAIGYNYILVVSEQMQQVDSLEPAKHYIKNYTKLNMQVVEICRKLFQKISHVTQRYLLEVLNIHGFGEQELYGLILREYIIYDCDFPFTADTVLTWSDQP